MSVKRNVEVQSEKNKNTMKDEQNRKRGGTFVFSYMICELSGRSTGFDTHLQLPETGQLASSSCQHYGRRG
jgi:hypothetical protein